MTGNASKSTATIVRSISQPRRGLRRVEAAVYVGISASKFDALVDDGRMPKPFRIDGCVLWDAVDLDEAIQALKDVGRNPWNA